MSVHTGQAFVLVGRGSLACGCAQQILDRGLTLAGVASTESQVRDWAAARGVPHAVAVEALPEWKQDGSAVLLSVSNDRLIAADQLGRFDLAINFHDGPLPAYSGSNVTAWALIARERSHAITWHRMTTRSDAGDILLRVPVPLSFDESALTLNGKCHAAALASFALLLDRITQGHLAGHPQNLAARVFHPRGRRPAREAVLDFRREAVELDALVRGLDWGEFTNPLGLAKLWLGDDFAVVRRLSLRSARSRHPPGNVVGIADDALTVATATHDVRLGGLLTLDGSPLPAAQLADRHGVHPGGMLPSDGDALAAALAQAGKCHGPDEAYWMDRWRELQPLVLPQSADDRAPACRDAVPGSGDEAAMLAVAGQWLHKTSGMPCFDVGLCDGPIVNGGLVAEVRPFRFGPEVPKCGDLLANWRRHGPHLRDAVLRYPGVERPGGWRNHADWPVVIQLGAEKASSRESRWPLHLEIDARRGEYRLASRPGAFAPRAFDALVRSLARHRA